MSCQPLSMISLALIATGVAGICGCRSIARSNPPFTEAAVPCQTFSQDVGTRGRPESNPGRCATPKLALTSGSTGFRPAAGTKSPPPEPENPAAVVTVSFKHDDQERAVDFSDLEKHALSLNDAVAEALSNSEVFRSASTFGALENPLLTAPDSVNTVHDPYVAATGVLFGNRSVAAAVSEFDPRFRLLGQWERDERVQNNRFLSGGLLPGETLVSDNAAVSLRLEKQLRTGGSMAVVQDWNYDSRNLENLLFRSVYTGEFRVEMRKPLWAGAGHEFTSIAGPVSASVDGISGVSQGVVVAAINEGVSRIDAQLASERSIREITAQYYQLVSAWSVYECTLDAHRDLREILINIKERTLAGGDAGRLSVAARFQMFDSEMQLQLKNAEADLRDQEQNMRRLMCWLDSSGQLLKPSQNFEIPDREYQPDLCVANALESRKELVRQRERLRSLRLQSHAARSLCNPRLDFVADYHVNGFGDHLLANTDQDGRTRQGLNNAWETILQGDQTGWRLGFEFLYPFGQRLAKTQMRNLELQIVRGRAILREQQNEIRHEVVSAVREVERADFALKKQRQTVDLAETRVAALRREYEVQATADSLSNVYDAGDSLLQARQNAIRAEADMSIALLDLHFRMGRVSSFHATVIVEAGMESELLPIPPADEALEE